MKSEAEYFMMDCHRTQPFLERDKRIVEFFSCWHEEDHSARRWDQFPKCLKCGADVVYRNPNLSTPNGYFWLQDHVKKDPNLWKDFAVYIYRNNISMFFITPDEFAVAVDQFISHKKMKEHQ